MVRLVCNAPDMRGPEAASRTRRGGWSCAIAWLFLLAAITSCPRRAGVESRDEGRLGRVSIYSPTGRRVACVFIFSDAEGWTSALDGAARYLASEGAAVIGVDLRAYLRGLAMSDDGCHYLISEIEGLSKRVQHDLGFPGYRSPILAGIGAGGTLAYAALAQSPAATVAGAVSVDAAPALATKVPLCAGPPSEAAPGGGFRYGPMQRLPGWWTVSPLDGLAADLRPLATPAQGDGVAPGRLSAMVRDAFAAGSATADAAALADLPIVEIPAATAGPMMAVIYSGDGGWRDIDKQIGEILAENGMPVVGIDSLRYFWRAKTPDQVAADLARIVAHFTAAWHAPRVVLIGYSFGAGVVPFAYNRLGADDRARVVQVTLLGVEHHALFEFTVAGWFGSAPGPDSPAVLPEVQRFPAGLLQCVYGEEEEDTICRDPGFIGADIIRMAGGHHFDGDYRAIAQRILASARARM